ncbi:ORF6N domain-containing protein [Bordetella bronchialis]|uniref:ORF6N domain-containing protein n=1 Tax=Bordetella bronchialis TaxID=463025 RepID=UPI003D054270
MSKVQTVSPESLPAVQWQGEKVITTELLARVYGTAPTNIKSNFNYNKDRFTEGKHYFRLTGNDLRTFKQNRVANSDPVTNSRAREVILWTERGAARHAKMLETDRAWEVFETLEDCYFAQKAKAKQEAERSTVWDRYPLYGFTIDTVLRHHLLFSKVYMLLNLFAGSRRFKDMTKQQVSEVIEFADRFAIGQDTRADWQRIQNNQMLLFGEPRQKDLVQMLLTAR